MHKTRTTSVECSAVFSPNYELATSEPSSPKRFLTEEAWKMFLDKHMSIRVNDYGDVSITITLRIPSDYEDRWKTPVQELVYRNVMYPDNTNAILEAADVEVGPYPSVTYEFKPKKGKIVPDELTDVVILNKSLGEWVKQYVVGHSFARYLGVEHDDRYVFIDELFYPPSGYAEMKQYLWEKEAGILILIGEPRVGKTYTAMHLLYDAYIELKASPFFCQSVEILPQVLDEAVAYCEAMRTDKGRSPCAFIYIDDPFGIYDYHEQSNTDFQGLVTSRYADMIKHNIRVIAASRRSIYWLAQPQFDRPFNNLKPKQVSFNLASDDNADAQCAYSLEALEHIFERIAWLKGAAWLTQYRKYKLQRGLADAVTDGTSPWGAVVRSTFAPGLIYGAFALERNLLELDGNKDGDIRLLAERLGDPEALRTVLGTELHNYMLDKQSRAAVRLYFLLPAMTVLRGDALEKIFREDDLSMLRDRYSDVLSCRSTDCQSATDSVSYFNDYLAEEASLYIAQNVAQVFEGEDSIFSYLEQRDRTPEDIISDVLFYYYSVGGNNDELVDRVLSSRKHTTSAKMTWVRLFQWLFSTRLTPAESDRTGDSYIEALLSEDLGQFSLFAFQMGEMLHSRFSLPNDAAGATQSSEALSKVTDFLTRLVRLSYERDSADRRHSHLRYSFLLHNLLAHAEDCLPPTEDKDGVCVALSAPYLQLMKTMLNPRAFLPATNHDDTLETAIICSTPS